MVSSKIIYDKLKTELNTEFEGGLLDYTIINMSYNSNKLEGSTLTEDQTEFLYNHDSIIADETDPIRMNDLIEMKNHFKLFKVMIKNADERLSEEIIKDYHRILKTGTRDELKKFKIGDYKNQPNRVSTVTTSKPFEVEKHIDQLLYKYNSIRKKSIKDIMKLHVDFETIHPFQDGNGRVGRIIMFKECLNNEIMPFIISNDTKEKYYNGLNQYRKNNSSILIDYIKGMQSEYEGMASNFVDY